MKGFIFLILLAFTGSTFADHNDVRRYRHHGNHYHHGNDSISFSIVIPFGDARSSINYYDNDDDYYYRNHYYRYNYDPYYYDNNYYRYEYYYYDE
jgi:hypothetical protein